MRTMLMNFRVLGLSALAVALLVASVPAFDAKDEKVTKSATHDGKVVNIKDNKLVMTKKGSKDEKEHSHILAADAKLTLDGKSCQAADLKPGTRIRVTTTGAGDKAVATKVEGLDKNQAFASNSHDGKVVRVTGNQLVMTDTQNEGEQTCTLTADVKITCDGKICKTSDLKPGMKIRVTSESNDPHAATRIEAIEKNRDFASL